MTRIPGRFVWFELYTPDVERSKAFWTELVGWTTGGGEGYLELGNEGCMCCGVMSTEKLPPGVPPHWLSYLSVDDVDAAAKACAANGGGVLREGFDIPDVGRIAIVEDTEGAVFGLFANAHDDPPDAPSVHGQWHWNELWAEDPARAVAFYESTFGYTHDEVSMPQGTYYVWMKDGGPRGGMMAKPAAEMPACWVPYLHVDGIDDVLERAKAKQAKVNAGPMDVEGVGRFAFITDDVGAGIGLITPAAGK